MRAMPMKADEGKIKGWHVGAAMIAFFGVIFAVNGVFLYSALSTHTGVIANEPYRKGLAYNERIAFDAAQTARGWVEEVALDADGSRLVVSLKDAKGGPVTGLKISGLVGRPSTGEQDVAVTLAETRPGHYEAVTNLTGRGTFMVNLEGSELGSEGERIVYRMRNRVWLKP